MSRAFSLAGFEVTLIGRFWVTTEGSAQPAVLIADHAGTGPHADVSQLGQWDLRTLRSGNQYTLQGANITAVVAKIPNINWVPLPPFDGGGHVFPPDRRHEYLFGIANGDSVTRQCVSFQIKVQEVSACGALCEYAGGTADTFERHFDVLANLFDLAEIGPEDFDA